MLFMTGEYERFVEEQSIAREEELLQLNVNSISTVVDSTESLADVSRSENKVNNRIF
jgi:hypothetical protein